MTGQISVEQEALDQGMDQQFLLPLSCSVLVAGQLSRGQVVGHPEANSSCWLSYIISSHKQGPELILSQVQISWGQGRCDGGEMYISTLGCNV